MRWLMEIIVPLVLFLCTLALVAVLFAVVVRYAWSGVADVSIRRMLIIPHQSGYSFDQE